MKKSLYKFIKSCIKILIALGVTFITAITASNNKNFVFNFLSQHGFSDPTIQNAVLSGLIVAIVGIVQQVLSLLNIMLLWTIKKYFKRLSLDIDFKVNNRSKQSINFKSIGGEYEEVQVDIELKITPAGKISLYILKFFGLQIEIFFNPQIIDVALVNDREWLDQKTNTRINNKQALCIGVLEIFRLGGMSMKPYIITESIVILPKRVKRETAYIDFKLTSVMGNRICRALCNSNMKELYIECEGVK